MNIFQPSASAFCLPNTGECEQQIWVTVMLLVGSHMFVMFH